MRSFVEELGQVLDPALIAHLTEGIVADEAAELRSVHTPLSGELLARVPQSTVSDVALAVQQARPALRVWKSLGHKRRAAVVLGFHDKLLARRDEVLDLIQLETGKTRANAFEEVAEVANVARFYARSAAALLAPRRVRGAMPVLCTATEQRLPRGVVGIITPWNYPFALSLGDALAALLAGNAVVLRPDPLTSLSVLWGVRLLVEAGLPQGVLQVVVGDGGVVGDALVRRADYVCFTGSTAVGRRVAKLAAERMVGCSLELGGKNALYVRRDADLDLAVDVALRGAFAGAGQVCVHTERLVLHAAIAEAFLARLIPAVDDMRLGVALDYGYDMGTLFGADQMARVDAHVRDAVRHGAAVLTGGHPRPDVGPWVYAPTVLDNVTAAMDVRDAETFGPVLSVYRVADDDAAVRLINDSDYGLQAVIVSADRCAARALARRLRCGTVSINETFLASWGATGAAMGARGESGTGGRHGADGLLRFTVVQSVAEQRAGSLAAARDAQEKFAALFSRGLSALRHARLR
ncbi:MAG: succinic semialdehyde dehydrogenase [Micropruina glycogenica]|uniref:Putative succinate-semialdehyde dehydrogenase [NADP(+)] n=1 Tax=Micropruina glycogenica TaxID=75385 RepID=A0A2N9JFY0_9ACTN|nr:succinic semialdehyde dehydrogenase [Micropruina glycogenica]MCB0892575.1 aldehyde dehydrogenase family protein [Propionibacteriaceae bacterium]SPD87020.1 putative succinate-semialdehyde dehydrogenase [NADP(+)] [Micropruina glycogenica]